MPSQEIKYNPSHLIHDDQPSRLRSLWDNDSIMSWIDTQPNPLESPEFYAPMAEHDPPQLTLLRDIKKALGEVWSLDHPFVHPLAVANFAQDDVSFQLGPR